MRASRPAAVDAVQKLALECGEFYCALVNFHVHAATVLYTGQLLEDIGGPSSMDHAQYCLLVVSVLASSNASILKGLQLLLPVPLHSKNYAMHQQASLQPSLLTICTHSHEQP